MNYGDSTIRNFGKWMLTCRVKAFEICNKDVKLNLLVVDTGNINSPVI